MPANPIDACVAPLDAVLAALGGTARVPRERWIDALLDAYNATTSRVVRQLVGRSITDARDTASVDAALARTTCALVVAALTAEAAEAAVAV